MWHCPSCGAPQAETARCWVCRRSSTTCSTCTHFRRALAGDLGYCGLDARRRPLTGQELRGCWEPRPEGPELNVLSKVLDEAGRVRRARTPLPAYRVDETSPAREFVPVESLLTAPAAGRADDQPVDDSEPRETSAGQAPPAFVIEPEPGWAERTSLFGEPEA
jgi:hypothetical protein